MKKVKRATNILCNIAIIVAILGLVAGFSIITKVFREYSCLQLFIGNLSSADLVTILSVAIPAAVGLILFVILLCLALIKGQKAGIYWAIVALVAGVSTGFLWGVLPTLHDETGWFYQTYLSSRLDIPMMEYGYYASVALVTAGAALSLIAFILGMIFLCKQETPVKPDKVKAKKEGSAEGEAASEANAEEKAAEEGAVAEGETVSGEGEGEEGDAESKAKKSKGVRIKLVKEDKVNSVTPVNKVYHVVKREDGKWHVKAAKSQKAIKLFDTKVEAVAYANALAKRQEASVAVHASKGENKGRIQKQ